MSNFDKLFLENKDPYALTAWNNQYFITIYNSNGQIEKHTFDNTGREIKQ